LGLIFRRLCAVYGALSLIRDQMMPGGGPPVGAGSFGLFLSGGVSPPHCERHSRHFTPAVSVVRDPLIRGRPKVDPGALGGSFVTLSRFAELGGASSFIQARQVHPLKRDELLGYLRARVWPPRPHCGGAHTAFHVSHIPRYRDLLLYLKEAVPWTLQG
jgi:hypothetical protein